MRGMKKAKPDTPETPVTPLEPLVDTTIPVPVLPMIDERRPVVAMRPCALDDAPVGSKVVMLDSTVVQKVPVLLTPHGERPMALNDLAFTLPIGAKVRKVVAGRFEAQQLNDGSGKAPLVTLTAREAMEQFVTYFHG